jgi:hypothetical protein
MRRNRLVRGEHYAGSSFYREWRPVITATVRGAAGQRLTQVNP